MINMKKSAVILILFAEIFTLNAEEMERRISLEEYRNLALVNNLEVHNAQFELEMSKEVRAEAFTHYFPKVSAMGGLVKPNIFGAGAAAGIKSDIDFQALFDVDVTNKTAHLDETINFNDPIGAWLGTITFSQTLFAGGRIINSNKLAQKGVEASAYKLQIKRSEIYAGAESKYYQFLLLDELIETLNIYKKTLDNLYEKVSEALSRGVISRTDYLRVSLKREEVTIQQEEMQQLRIIALQDFKLFAGIKDNEKFIVSAGFEEIVEPKYNTDDFPAQLAGRPEFNLLTIQRDAAKLEEAITRGSYLPSIELGVSFIRSDFYLNGKVFTNTKGFYQDFAGFLLFNIPMTEWWSGYHKIKEKNLARKSADEQLAVNSHYLLLDMQNKMTTWQTAYKHVKLAEIGVEYAQHNREEYEQKYQAGISTLSDYLMALGLEHENATKLDQAKTQYFIARTAFYTATGKAH
jgi:outer membrane protein TolC